MLRALRPLGGAEPYAAQSHHHLWGQGLASALAATSPQDMEAAKAGLPAPPDGGACRRAWLAAHDAWRDACDAAAAAPLALAPAPTAGRPRAAEKEDDQGDEGAAEARALDVLASFAAQDLGARPEAARPLRAAAAADVRGFAARARACARAAAGQGVAAGASEDGDSVAGRGGRRAGSVLGVSASASQASLAASAAPREAEEDDDGGREALDPRVESDVWGLLAAAEGLLAVLRRSGLLPRLLAAPPPATAEAASTPLASSHGGAAADIAERVSETVRACARAWRWRRRVGGAAVGAACVGLAAHVRHGDASLLRRAAAALAADEEALRALAAQAGALEAAAQQHAASAAALERRMQVRGAAGG